MADLRSSVSERQSGGRRLSLASEARQDAVAGSPNLVAVALRHFDFFAGCTFFCSCQDIKDYVDIDGLHSEKRVYP